MDNDAEPYTDLPPLVGFRLRLRTLFILVTLVCILLGLKLASEQRRGRIVARHHALVDTLSANILSPPPNITYQTEPGDVNEIASNINFNDVDFLGFEFLDAGGPQRVSGRSLVLDVSKLAPTNSPADLARDLVQHYETGLTRLGMHQWQSVHGIGLDGRQSRSVWTSDDHELAAVIDVDIAAERGLAEIRILVIDGQSRDLW
jgi:hypothetical protein